MQNMRGEACSVMCDSASVTVSPRKAEEGQETQYPGQQQQPQGTCPLPPHHRDGHASTQTVADKAPRQSPIGPRMATADPATQPAAWDRQGMEPRALWAQEQPPHPHRTRGPANAQEDQAAPDAPPGCAGTRPRALATHEAPAAPPDPPPHQTSRPPPPTPSPPGHPPPSSSTLPPSTQPTHSPAHPLTHIHPTHFLSHSPAQTLGHLLTHSPPSDPLVHSLTHTRSLTHSPQSNPFIHPLTHSLTHRHSVHLIHSLIHSLHQILSLIPWAQLTHSPLPRPNTLSYSILDSPHQTHSPHHPAHWLAQLNSLNHHLFADSLYPAHSFVEPATTRQHRPDKYQRSPSSRQDPAPP